MSEAEQFFLPVNTEFLNKKIKKIQVDKTSAKFFKVLELKYRKSCLKS